MWNHQMFIINSGGSQGSLLAVRSRATSNSTLLSEVISMRRFAPRKCRHSRLREVDPEAEEGAGDSSDSQRFVFMYLSS